jgi:aspartyl/asparaginyl-tRNA synthetase
MLTKEKIDQFYKDVEGLNLRFPVAELHRMTGFSKGQISQVLGKTLSPSDDLIKEFYKSLNKVQSADSIAIYERIIEEKEARRRDAEAWAQKMEAHYNDMKNALERAQTTINEVLKPIKEQTAEILTSSKKAQEALQSLKTEVVSEHGEMMETLDQIAGNEPGTTAAKAGTLELAHRVQLQKGKKASTGK